MPFDMSDEEIRNESTVKQSGAGAEVNADSADAIINLERKLTRALQRAAGINLKPADLDLLAAIGVFDCLSGAKSLVLKEKAKWRQKEAYTNAAHTGSTMTEEKTGPP